MHSSFVKTNHLCFTGISRLKAHENKRNSILGVFLKLVQTQNPILILGNNVNFFQSVGGKPVFAHRHFSSNFTQLAHTGSCATNLNDSHVSRSTLAAPSRVPTVQATTSEACLRLHPSISFASSSIRFSPLYSTQDKKVNVSIKE